MSNPLEDLENRRLVWDAMQELYRDTELTPRDLECVAKTLCVSPYSVAELDRIMFKEVYPVLIGNLLAVAGEWKGFQVESLQEAILERLAKRWKWPAWLIPGRSFVRDDWRKVKEIIAASVVERPR